MIDQNDTLHTYSRDQLGRQISDAVTLPDGSAVDDSVLRIDTAYALDGNVALTTSYSSADGGSENIVNQVADDYNAFGLLADEYQSVSGAVDDSTPNVHYAYADGTSTPTVLVSMTYPNGRVLDYGYNSGTDAAVNRPSFLKDGNNSTHLVDYKYLGLSTIDDVSSPEPGIDNNLGEVTDGVLDRVDQFNQAVDQVFSRGGINLQEIKYGRNVLGDVTWRANLTATANGANLDQLNTYNALEEVTNQEVGALNGDDTAITGTPDESESFSPDGMGNIANYTQTVAGTTTVDQDRSPNGLNQITSVAGWITPAYDAAGNMTTIPQPGNETVGLRSVYDAWNRLTVVYVGDSTTPLVNYSYDGLNRRDVEIAGGQTTAIFTLPVSPSPSGRGAGGEGYQDIEERVSSSPLPLGEGQGEGSGESFESTASIIAALPANLQNVWGLRYVDDLVLRDRATGGIGDLGINGSGLDERLYALQDANWNVIALVSTSGDVAERFNYTVFGVATALNPDFTSYSGTDYQWTTLFAGRDIDANTGLYYNRARWYDAGLAVFTSTDAMPSLNPYWYTDNNPLNATDPSGQSSTLDWRWDSGPIIPASDGLSYANAASGIYGARPPSNPSLYEPESPVPAQAKRDGAQSAGMGNYFGLSRDFWNWYHKQYKGPGDPDIDKPTARQLYDEWQTNGRPDGEGHRTVEPESPPPESPPPETPLPATPSPVVPRAPRFPLDIPFFIPWNPEWFLPDRNGNLHA